MTGRLAHLNVVSNEPRPVARAGGPYVEEIKSPVPRDTLLFSPNCFVR